MFDVIWDIFQQRQIHQLQNSNSAKNNRQDDKQLGVEIRLKDLEQRHEQLKLVTLSLWALLKDHTGLLESDLKKYVENLDLTDGKLDGKVHIKETVDCTGCSRSILTTSHHCPYCGNQLKRKNVFSRA